ncbi:hypothetical protein BUH_3018 [Burkholderia pseudomallei Pakistan 9]|nr:hypothetical protein BUH_3018 [Burkholderia pseudomallei Pakistan 9]
MGLDAVKRIFKFYAGSAFFICHFKPLYFEKIFRIEVTR